MKTIRTMPNILKSTKLLRIAAPAATATALLLAAGAANADSRIRQTEVRQLRENGKILPMEQILSRARSNQPGQVVEIELERKRGVYVYEVKLIDDQDTIHKLELDAGSGNVLRRKEEWRKER